MSEQLKTFDQAGQDHAVLDPFPERLEGRPSLAASLFGEEKTQHREPAGAGKFVDDCGQPEREDRKLSTPEGVVKLPGVGDEVERNKVAGEQC